jgi:hypothetical protein
MNAEVIKEGKEIAKKFIECSITYAICKSCVGQGCQNLPVIFKRRKARNMDPHNILNSNPHAVIDKKTHV